jgi:hypothetical protein
MKGLKNELAWESAGELAFFIAPIDRIQLALGTPIFARFLAGALPRPPLRSGLLRAPAKKRVNGYFAPKSSFPLLNRLSSLLNRRQHPIPPPARHFLRKFPMAGGLPAHAVPRMSWGEPAESWNKTSS